MDVPLAVRIKEISEEAKPQEAKPEPAIVAKPPPKVIDPEELLREAEAQLGDGQARIAGEASICRMLFTTSKCWSGFVWTFHAVV